MTEADRVVARAGRWRALVDHAARTVDVAAAIVIALLIMKLVLMLNP